MPTTFHHHTCENGLTILVEANDEAHTAAVGFFVRAGARDEVAKSMGVSHFLEHMMFKGTQRRTADDVNREFDEIGANYNAFTSHEQTVYYAHVLPEYLPRAVDLWTDLLRPALRDQDFEMEKNVILEEIGMYEDRPTFRLQDTLHEKTFGSHPMGFRVLGTQPSIKAMNAQQMRAYFEQRYSPDNIVVAAAGKVDVDALVKDVQSKTAHWQPSGVTRAYNTPDYDESQTSLYDKKLSQHYVGMMWPGPSAQDERRYAARIYTDILGDASGSRIYWALIDTGLAEEADVSFMPHDQLGNFLGYASCDPNKADEVESILKQTIERFHERIDKEEVFRARNKIATQATLAGEMPSGRMMALGGTWSYLGKYLPLEAEIERLATVTVDDLHELLETYPFADITTVRLNAKS